MERQVIISSPHMHLDDTNEKLIHRLVEKLERKFPRLVGCRVSLEPPVRPSSNAAYRVGVEMRVPASDPLIARGQHEVLASAIRDAFAAAQRRLDDYSEKLRGEVKRHVQ